MEKVKKQIEQEKSEIQAALEEAEVRAHHWRKLRNVLIITGSHAKSISNEEIWPRKAWLPSVLATECTYLRFPEICCN